ncbi:hypothetical protein J6590_057120 [Homalodisca vitripennis]|nr:hypothetical protein J6590_057120 [Homalodisca vitripennis]
MKFHLRHWTLPSRLRDQRLKRDSAAAGVRQGLILHKHRSGELSDNLIVELKKPSNHHSWA